MRKKWSFDRDSSGFRYEDDTFRFTEAPSYARGRFVMTKDERSGEIAVVLGGVSKTKAREMSGGWTKPFSLEEDEALTLSFQVKVEQSEDYRRGEHIDVRVLIDGEPHLVKGKATLLRVEGDGRGGKDKETAWKTIKVDLGELDAGRHTVTLGAWGNRISSKNSVTKVLFDNVEVETTAKEVKPVRLAAFEKEVLRLTNAFRDKNGLDPVTADKNLVKAAEDWSREMATGDFYRHSELPDQFEDFGYKARGYAENIAAGFPSAKAVVNAWIDSPGHRKNMLRDDVEHIGIGHYYQKNDRGDTAYGHYWTQILADPSGDYMG